MNSKLRLGLVGFGKIARDQHSPAIARSDDFELVAAADPITRVDGVRNYPGIEAMLAGEADLDAVVLCQPPQVRCAAARLALEAGKHVFLEKPPGVTVTEAAALKDLAAARGVTLFAAWHSRYAAGVAQAREWIAARRPSAIRIVWKEDVRVWHPGQEWIWRAGGFGVFDPGINALSILTAIVPGQVSVSAAELTFPENCNAPIAARLALATAGGVPVSAEFDFRQTGPQSWDIVVEAERETLVLSHGGNALACDGVAMELPPEQEYDTMYRRFAELVRGGMSEADLAPLIIVADAFLCGEIRQTEPFHY